MYQLEYKDNTKPALPFITTGNNGTFVHSTSNLQISGLNLADSQFLMYDTSAFSAMYSANAKKIILDLANYIPGAPVCFLSIADGNLSYSSTLRI